MILHEIYDSLKPQEEEEIRVMSYKNKQKCLLFKKYNLVLLQAITNLHIFLYIALYLNNLAVQAR